MADRNRIVELLAGLADEPLSWWERRRGLGPDAQRVYYGQNEPAHKSLLLSYALSLREKAAQEREAGQGGADYDDGAKLDLSQIKIPKPKDTIRAARRFIKEVTDNKPKVLEGDTLTPKERVRRHINFEEADRVAVAPQLGYHVARAGGITVRDFMCDGAKAAHAARRAWDTYGGFDMIPFNFPMAYLFPFVPDSHTRFWNKWEIPEGDELPKMEETPLLADCESAIRDGIIPLARTEGGRLLKEFRHMLLQGAIYGAHTARLFPRTDLYYPYAASIVNHPADILSFWMGFEPFMMACATDPQRMREACEALGPGLVEAGEFIANLSGSKQVLYGVSRVSSSYMSRKMFDDLFAQTFLDQVWKLHNDGYVMAYHLDNNYTPMLDFFKELPARSGFMHLDQTDLVKAKEVLHGHLCLMGNLHPGLTSKGTPAQVEAECERLIKEVGAGGGFILCSACEVPIDAPEENIRAIKSAVDKWGWYS